MRLTLDDIITTMDALGGDAVTTTEAVTNAGIENADELGAVLVAEFGPAVAGVFASGLAIGLTMRDVPENRPAEPGVGA